MVTLVILHIDIALFILQVGLESLDNRLGPRLGLCFHLFNTPNLGNLKQFS